MAETLGSLCDKLTIVKLKQYHSSDETRLNSLDSQEKALKNEIDSFLLDALSGIIPVAKLSFDANKVYKQEGNHVKEFHGSMGTVFSELARINCDLWHEQEKVYEFETIPVDQKDVVVKKLAILNLERNKCIDRINTILVEHVAKT